MPNKLQSESLCEVVGRRGEVQKDAKETPKTSDSAAIYQFTENNIKISGGDDVNVVH